MKIAFHGAAQEVAGARTMVETSTVCFLIDCGMIRGGRNAGRNRASFAFDPRSVGFVPLTHARTDLSGLLPKPWRDGVVARGEAKGWRQ